MGDDNWFIKELEGFLNWLKPKIEWTAVMLALLGVSYAIGTLIYNALSPQSQEQSQYRYSLPEKCYCQACGSWVDLRKYGLYGKHCREIAVCPICGAGGYPLWRSPRKT